MWEQRDDVRKCTECVRYNRKTKKCSGTCAKELRKEFYTDWMWITCFDPNNVTIL